MLSSAPLMSLLFSVGVVVTTAAACNRANPNYHPGESPTSDGGGLTGQAGGSGAARQSLAALQLPSVASLPPSVAPAVPP